MTSANASRTSSRVRDSPAASLRIARCSAVALASLADTQCLDQALREAGAHGDERDHEAQQAHAFDVFVDEDALHGAVREIHDADELVEVHERETDEGTAGEV